MHWTAVVPVLLVKSATAPCALPSVQKPAVAGVVAVLGDVAKPFSLSASDAGKFTSVHSDVRQPSDYGAIAGHFEGVSIADVLKVAGASAKATKVGLIDSAVVARAALDDPSHSAATYEVTLSYSEISPLLSRHPAFVAFRCNGFPITPTLVVPDDLTSARYVHELSSLTLRVTR